jgi:gamma-glutamylcyclotransferase (GGCT)/AIG2-like uncharacterized protein YtfP
MISSSRRKRDSLLFVYGTLRPFAHIPLARWLAQNARHLGCARTRGRLHDLGNYPGLVAARRGGEWVIGDLYALPRVASLLRLLDRYETAPRGRGRVRFVRVRRLVQSQTGGEYRPMRQHAAWLYLYGRSVLSRARIRCGDYEHFVRGGHVLPGAACRANGRLPRAL